MTPEVFFHNFSIHLNKQQQEAVQTINGPTLLLAVPGSGKTTVLVTRIGFMIYCCGIDPRQIMTITYTRAAAADMRRRFSDLFGEQMAKRLDFRTINSLCLDIIKTYGIKHKSIDKMFKQYSEGEILPILSTLYYKYEKEYPTESDLQSLATTISYAKNMMLSSSEITALGKKEGYSLWEIFCDYNKYLKNNAHMDFDDQMIYAYKILRQHPDILDMYQKRYPFFCVDEAQDTSKIQHKVIALLTSKTDNLFMVGDEDQSIYGFRAAYPKALLDFEMDHPNSRILLMEKNYRSNAKIVVAADQFIQLNTMRHEKRMIATRPEGSDINIIPLKGRRAQYVYLSKVAAKCDLQTAVLYRYNESVIPLVDMLEREGIPYSIKGADLSFFTSRVVNDISDILRFALDPYDTEIFMRIYYKIRTYLKKTDAQIACNESRKNKIPVLEAAVKYCNIKLYTADALEDMQIILNNMRIINGEKAIHTIMTTLGYKEYLERNKMNERKVSILSAIGANEKTPVYLLDRLEYLRELLQEKEPDNRCPFILSTIHSSKGLEYDRVYLIDVADGIFPERIPQNINSAGNEEKQEYEEERRLFYVAATRAKDELNIFDIGREASFTDQLVKRKKDISSTERQKKKPTHHKTGILYSRPVVSNEDVLRFIANLGKGIMVEHKKFGKGTIIKINTKTTTIKFDEVEKTFDTEVLCSSKLIKIP